ncbi:SIR2 family protein [Streptococcus halitosis]|uniref:SIR2 family protein n=1 Tax=Streptococcus halitosis TaxID=2172545 RepID=UPI002004B3FA|nr:SIR2 family protein [Streptococcus halitosis]MCK6129417.1 SIR2 family protein [Streptococcus halitosis]MCK6216420.1 SIR2 family protein [Streptococcus halitosis]
MDFFYDDEKDKDYEKIELHYLSNTISYGLEKKNNGETVFYDSNGKLEHPSSQEEQKKAFTKIDFQRVISEKIRKIVYGEKYSNIVFLAGAGASVVGGNSNYGKTVKMIADDVFLKLNEADELFTLEALARQCMYKNGNILDEELGESAPSRLDDGFNLEDFLSTLFHYRPYVPDTDKDKFNNSIEKILQLIKENTNYSYDSKELKHGKLLNFLSSLSGKEGNKFSVITTNYDVLIEEAAAANNFVIFDGFNFTPIPKFDSSMFEWNLIKEVQNINTREVEYKDKTFNLLKIHGSLTWEKQDDGAILRKDKDSITDTNKMVMVFPSSDKYAQSYQEPYFELFTKFQDLIKRPNTLLISSGFSFADVHISKMVTQALKNNTSLKLLITDFNIDPNREYIKDVEKFKLIDEADSKYNQNWAELIDLMDEGYPITFLKATMNSDLVDFLKGKYLNDKD